MSQDKYVNVFNEKLQYLSSAGRISLKRAPFVSFDDRVILDKRMVMFLIPPLPEVTSIPEFDRFREALDEGFDPQWKYAEIYHVIEYPELNVREALIKVPLQMFANTSYRDYSEKFGKIKMPAHLNVYMCIPAEHRLYNFIDLNNKIITKFYLEPDGSVLTKIGTASTAYQYMCIIGNSVDFSAYAEYHLTTPYKKRVREINESSNKGNKYRGIDLKASFVETDNVLYELDFFAEADLANIPKKDIMMYAKVKESVDLNQQILTQLSTIGDDEGVKLPTNLVLKKDRVEYFGQILKSDFIDTQDFLFNTKKCFPNISRLEPSNDVIFIPYIMTNGSIEELDWDRYLLSFLKFHWIKATMFDGKINLIIGEVPVSLEYRKKTSTFYINDKRINRDEVTDVMLKALCANKPDIFAETLDMISKTSLEMHKFISEGLVVSLKFNDIPKELQSYLDEEISLRKDLEISFKIAREKGINYIEVGKNFVRIKNSRKLMDLRGRSVNYSELMAILSDENVVAEKIPVDVDFGEIIEKARKRYIAAFNKSKELLQEALDTLGAEITDFSESRGVLVTGMSGNQYFIKASNIDDPMKGEPECSVYLYPNNTHICIVDKHGAAKQAGVDKLVARMYALRNDSVLTDEIHTLKTHVNN